MSVWLVDSAVRWRRNDVVGKENRCSFAVVCSRFFWRLFFATCSVARAAASRHGGSSLRLSPDSLLRRQRSLRSGRAYVVSSQALLRSALCCSRAEASGASFASLRRAGLRLARLKPVFSSVNCNYPSKSSGFYEFGLHSTLVDLRTNRTSFPSTYPRCRQLHIPVCRGVENNSKCTIHNSQLRSSSSF